MNAITITGCVILQKCTMRALAVSRSSANGHPHANYERLKLISPFKHQPTVRTLTSQMLRKRKHRKKQGEQSGSPHVEISERSRRWLQRRLCYIVVQFQQE
ncbi:uncharacterized protein [Physcomitrium patens]|uniref:uncharacterized protein n=1 Tax=Physcomitrium patens TaxID=3218 RepID=UPI003CCDE604